MFERLRFVRYALKFERAFKTDDWEAVKACFHPDGRYVLIGGKPPFDGEFRGPDEIVRIFQRMLNELDRKFDHRKPGLAGWPRVRGGELTLPWKVRYTLRDQTAMLTGLSRCRFSGGKIIELSDTMIPEECERWEALARTA